jgi:hypothetical protein
LQLVDERVGFVHDLLLRERARFGLREERLEALGREVRDGVVAGRGR